MEAPVRRVHVSIILTPTQAAALGQIAGDARGVLQLHQVGEDPDVLITWAGATEPQLLLRADGTLEAIADKASRAAERARPG